MERREMLSAAAATAAAVVAASVAIEAQANPTTTDRNGDTVKVGMFVYVPALVTAITPSLNPALTSVTVQTLPNVGSAEYDEGLSLVLYSSHLLKP